MKILLVMMMLFCIVNSYSQKPSDRQKKAETTLAKMESDLGLKPEQVKKMKPLFYQRQILMDSLRSVSPSDSSRVTIRKKILEINSSIESQLTEEQRNIQKENFKKRIKMAEADKEAKEPSVPEISPEVENK